jgi:hypothetical protein
MTKSNFSRQIHSECSLKVNQYILGNSLHKNQTSVLNCFAKLIQKCPFTGVVFGKSVDMRPPRANLQNDSPASGKGGRKVMRGLHRSLHYLVFLLSTIMGCICILSSFSIASFFSNPRGLQQTFPSF